MALRSAFINCMILLFSIGNMQRTRAKISGKTNTKCFYINRFHNGRKITLKGRLTFKGFCSTCFLFVQVFTSLSSASYLFNPLLSAETAVPHISRWKVMLCSGRLILRSVTLVLYQKNTFEIKDR